MVICSIKSQFKITIHTKQKWFLKIIYYKLINYKNNSNKSNKTELKENFAICQSLIPV